MYKNKYKMIMLIWIKNKYVRTVCINLTELLKQSSKVLLSICILLT